MDKKYRRIVQGILMITMILFLIPVFWISLYNHPSVDDFWYGSYYTRDAALAGGGIWKLLQAAMKTNQYFLESWQGIYSSGIVLSLHPGIFGEQYYPLTTLILVTSLYLGLFFFVKCFLKAMRVKSQQSWLIAAILAFFFIETLPCPVQGLYWFNGSMNYLFFTSVLLMLIGLLCSLNYENSIRNQIWKTIVGLLLVIFVEGGNHVTAFAGVLFTMGFAVYAIISKRHITQKLLFFVTSLICFAMNLLSPGTSVRLHEMGYQGSILNTMLQSIKGAFNFIVGWRSLSLLCLAILLGLLFYPILVKSAQKRIFRWRIWLLSMILSFGLFCAMLCVPYQAMGNFGAWRILNIDYLTYELFLFFHVFYGMGCLASTRKWLGWKLKGTVKRCGYCLAFMGLLVAIGVNGGSVIGRSTSLEAIQELRSGEAQQYHREMMERLNLYLDESVQEVYVKPLTVKPELLFFDDLEMDITDWRNESIARYYHKKLVGYVQE